MQLTGAQIVIECLKEQGVDTIFGYPGGAILNVYDEFYKHSSEIRHILVSHEQGASLGAKAAFPDKTVINITGDGGFRMNMNELATASRNNLPIIEVIIDTRVLGMVRQWQTLFYECRYSYTVLDDGVDYIKLSEAMGCNAYAAQTPEEFSDVFKKALKSDKPVVIDCRIDKDENVYPMVAPGESISKVFDDSDMDN